MEQSRGSTCTTADNSATGSDYFASCYEHHVPKDSDLFIIEAAVNDLLVYVPMSH